MKKALLITALLATASVVHAAALRYENTSASEYILGSANPSVGLAQTGWTVGAFIETGGGAGFQFGSDTLYHESTLFDGNAAGGVQGIYNALGGDTLSDGNVIYTVVFNQAGGVGSIGGTYAYTVTANSPYTVTGPAPQQYGFGGDGTWVVVPEPATYALFGLGLVTLALHRRRRR